MMGRGMHNYINAPEGQPKFTRALLKRVFDYALPYRKQIIFTLILILLSTGLTLLSPLILRDLIDKTLPEKNIPR